MEDRRQEAGQGLVHVEVRFLQEMPQEPFAAGVTEIIDALEDAEDQAAAQNPVDGRMLGEKRDGAEDDEDIQR